MELTRDNYYSAEANAEYWSSTIIKQFYDCQHRGLAIKTGKITESVTDALLVGSLIDSYFDSNLEYNKFILAHPEMFNAKTGELKAPFRQAEAMIKRAEDDSMFMDFMTGDKQTIWTGKIAGFPFRAKLDVYDGKRIVDLKTTKSFAPVYVEGEGRMDFCTAYWYPLQMAIYQELVYQNTGKRLPVYLACISKETPPDLMIIEIPQKRLDTELSSLEEKLPLFDAITQGIVQPERCGRCDYCRATHRLTEVTPLTELEDF